MTEQRAAMRIYAVTNHNSIPGPKGYPNLWPYDVFFHGGSRHDMNWYGERPYDSPELVRNIRLMPPIFFAGISMAVNAPVADQLRSFNFIDLQPCKWKKIYDYPIDEQHVRDLMARFSILPDGFEEWLETLMEAPDERVRDIAYFQVIVPLLERISSEFTCDVEIKLPDPAYDEIPPVRTCIALHNKFPIVRIPPYYLATEAVFHVLSPNMSDKAMFRVHPFDIG
jgi:hypothetical protein